MNMRIGPKTAGSVKACRFFTLNLTTPIGSCGSWFSPFHSTKGSFTDTTAFQFEGGRVVPASSIAIMVNPGNLGSVHLRVPASHLSESTTRSTLGSGTASPICLVKSKRLSKGQHSKKRTDVQSRPCSRRQLNVLQA